MKIISAKLVGVKNIHSEKNDKDYQQLHVIYKDETVNGDAVVVLFKEKDDTIYRIGENVSFGWVNYKPVLIDK